MYVNWRNGTDFLQRNELVLETVIRWVNANKQPDLLTGLINPNVVLGSSMGGVIARMALGRMDRGGGQNGAGGFAAHQTNLYVSLDAPHQGANVPLGYQAAARHAARIYIRTGPIAALVEVVQFFRGGVSPLQATFLADQPASKQMLNQRINFFYNQSNSDNQQFLQELRTQWAYPNPILQATLVALLSAMAANVPSIRSLRQVQAYYIITAVPKPGLLATSFLCWQVQVYKR